MSLVICEDECDNGGADVFDQCSVVTHHHDDGTRTCNQFRQRLNACTRSNKTLCDYGCKVACKHGCMSILNHICDVMHDQDTEIT